MIDARLDGPIARITLDRPEAHNALDRPAIAELLALLDAWSARDDLRALVLTGRGRSFCAGAALGDVAGADWTDNPLTRLCDALEAFPLPTVAGLNGGVYGGGVELALACDFRVGVAGMRAFVEQSVEEQSLPFFLSGMVYDDGVIDPRETRTILGICLSVIANQPVEGTDRFGVFRP